MTDFRRTIPSMYKRALSWRLTGGSPASVQSDLEGMFRLATSDFPDILEDYLCISRKRKSNRTVLSRQQLHMIGDVLALESGVKQCKEGSKSIRGRSGAIWPR
jgi:hypothetical protein